MKRFKKFILSIMLIFVLASSVSAQNEQNDLYYLQQQQMQAQQQNPNVFGMGNNLLGLLQSWGPFGVATVILSLAYLASKKPQKKEEKKEEKKS